MFQQRNKDASPGPLIELYGSRTRRVQPTPPKREMNIQRFEHSCDALILGLAVAAAGIMLLAFSARDTGAIVAALAGWLVVALCGCAVKACVRYMLGYRAF